jgi:kumamolisin
MFDFRRSGFTLGCAFACAASTLPATAASLSRQTQTATRAFAPPALRGTFAGEMQPATQLSLMISLQGQHESEIDRVIVAQNTPGSPMYGKYLSPQQYGRYFGATDREYAAAITTLRARGFVVDDAFANRSDIEVHAPASVVESFFGTPIDMRTERGRIYFTNRYAPLFPAGLHVLAVAGLDNYLQLHPHHAHHTGASFPDTGWTPPNIQSVYNLTPIYSKYTGAGVPVVDATFGLVRDSDFGGWQKKFGLKASLKQVYQKGAPLDDNGESTLDVQWMASIAPQAKVVLVSPKANTNAGFIWMYATIVNKLSGDRIVSTSWGSCEQVYGMYGYVVQNEKLFRQAQLEGQWWMAAAGDWGSDDCQLTQGGMPSVDYPGSSKYVMSVGGTAVVPASVSGDSYRGWSGESVWNQNECGAGGGGNSTLFVRPTFQNGLSSAYAREVPDVVFMASGCDLGGYVTYFRGKWANGDGGTSYAAPQWAGFLTLVASRYGSTPIPSPLYRLYALYAASGGRYFHNIVRGCNTYFGVPGYCAHHGYSPVGGLGSFNGAPLQAAY